MLMRADDSCACGSSGQEPRDHLPSLLLEGGVSYLMRPENRSDRLVQILQPPDVGLCFVYLPAIPP